MDFDEYEYLEKTVENPEPQKLKEDANGGDAPLKSGEKDRSRSSWHRGEDDDVNRKPKRSRSGDDLIDRDRRRDKGSSRHRSRSGERSDRDGERHKSSREREHRDKYREREERNGRDRDRERERERDRERKERDHEKEVEINRNEREHRSRSCSDRHRDDRERSQDREVRGKSRDREVRGKSRDREVRERSRESEYRERSRDRERRERSRDIEPRDKESRRHKEKKEEAAEPEADPERDQRTVFAYQLPLRADERDIFEFFSRAGKVRDVRLIMDRNSRRSKGVGYIEFYDVMSVPMAIALSGQPIRGQPVMVKPSEAEKNLVQSTSTTAAGAGGLTGSGAARRLYVGNLVPNITEEQLRVVFEPFGTIELVQLPRDETGLCKGFAFVQFARLEDAKAAQNLNGQLDIGGRFIKVSAVTDQPGMQDAGAATGDLDDDEGGGLALNASSRALLMQKLDRSAASSSIPGTTASPAVNNSAISAASAPIFGATPGVSPLVQPPVSPLGGLPGAGLAVPSVNVPTADSIGVPSECLLLKNMFDLKLETEPDFDLDIKDDVQDECAKFGPLKHIFVDKNSDGFVYLKFDNTQAAMNAQRALHGRWFAGKMISALFMLPENYEAKFPESR